MPKFNEIEAKKEMDEIRNSKRKPRKELNAVNLESEGTLSPEDGESSEEVASETLHE